MLFFLCSGRKAWPLESEVWACRLVGRPQEEAGAGPLLYLDRSDIRIGNNWKAAERKTQRSCASPGRLIRKAGVIYSRICIYAGINRLWEKKAYIARERKRDCYGSILDQCTFFFGVFSRLLLDSNYPYFFTNFPPVSRCFALLLSSITLENAVLTSTNATLTFLNITLPSKNRFIAFDINPSFYSPLLGSWFKRGGLQMNAVN